MPFNPDNPYNDLPFLPPKAELETKAVLRKAIPVNKALAELKARGVDSESMWLDQCDRVAGGEAVIEIENIMTTWRDCSIAPHKMMLPGEVVLP